MARARDETLAVAGRDDERAAMDDIARLLTRPGGRSPRLVGADGDEVEIPESLIRVLVEAAKQMSRERMVVVVPLDREVTTQQAADVLNVSRPYLVRLLDEGMIPSRKTGAHRRVLFDDLMRYKRMRDDERRRHLRRLTQVSQEMGLYDPERPGTARRVAEELASPGKI